MWSILRLLREDPDKLRWSQQRRGLDPGIVDEALKYDRLWRKALSELNRMLRDASDVDEVYDVVRAMIAVLEAIEKVRRLSR